MSEGDPDRDEPNIGWSRDVSRADDAVRFFIENVDASYISHGELQGGRAIDADAWSTSLPEKLKQEILAAMTGAPSCSIGRSRRIALLEIDGVIGALAMVAFHQEAFAYAILDDLVVSRSHRGLGVGQSLLRWIENECRTRGIKRLFLESGAGNHRAHHFFEMQSYNIVSHVMMKNLF